MKRPFLERTYSGEIPRPSMEVTRFENDNFLMAATPWGNRDALREITSSYSEFLTANMADREATSPFSRLPTLSSLANSLRAATLYANDKACRKCNQESYTSGCETLVMAFENAEMAWVQVGQPHLFMIRKNKLIPLEVALDLGIDFQMAAPLPGRLFGIDRQIDITVKSLLLQPEDRLVMLARSTIPSSLFAQKVSSTDSGKTLEMLFNAAVAADGKLPFWISILG